MDPGLKEGRINGVVGADCPTTLLSDRELDEELPTTLPPSRVRGTDFIMYQFGKDVGLLATLGYLLCLRSLFGGIGPVI